MPRERIKTAPPIRKRRAVRGPELPGGGNVRQPAHDSAGRRDYFRQDATKRVSPTPNRLGYLGFQTQEPVLDYTIEFDEKRGIAVFRFSGNVTEESFLAAATVFRDFIEKNPVTARITDFSSAGQVLLSAEFIRKLAISDLFERGKPNLMRVIVAPQPAVFGLARLFEMSREPFGNAPVVVRSMEEALQVFGVESLNLTPVQ